MVVEIAVLRFDPDDVKDVSDPHTGHWMPIVVAEDQELPLVLEPLRDRCTDLIFGYEFETQAVSMLGLEFTPSLG